MNKSGTSKTEGYVERYREDVLKVPPSIFNFKGTDTDEPVHCSFFGCGRKLSLIESMAGDRCTSCMGKVKIDPTCFASHPNKKSSLKEK